MLFYFFYNCIYSHNKKNLFLGRLLPLNCHTNHSSIFTSTRTRAYMYYAPMYLYMAISYSSLFRLSPYNISCYLIRFGIYNYVCGILVARCCSTAMTFMGNGTMSHRVNFDNQTCSSIIYLLITEI